MTSLRARITLLLIVSIIGVVALASVVATSTMRPPDPGMMMQPLANQLAALLRLGGYLTGPASGVFHLEKAPVTANIDRPGTHFLSDALRRAGIEQQVIVSRSDDKMTASIERPDGQWLISTIPNFGPPPGRTRSFLMQMALILLGAVAIAVGFAALLTRPLKLLQTAVEHVGADGLLPRIDESGPRDVQATAKALNQLSSRLQAAMESRMRLVAAAGHDLRTPITRMRLRAEFLEEPQRAKWLRDMDELERIAESAIALVREETAPSTLEEVCLDDLLRDVSDELALLSYDVKIGGLEACTIRADHLPVQRALRNLTINAATHGKGCTLTLSHSANAAVIEISDHGPGIPEDLLNKAFEPFFRVDPARRQAIPGAGLGMAIAKEIIERNGGRISIKNRTDGGLIQRIIFSE